MHPNASPHIPRAAVTGVILAGGAGRRMGGLDKGLVPVAGRPLVEWVIDALAPQVATLLISANRNLDRYGAHGYPVVEDADRGFQGPLAGILTAMRAASTPWILTLPCDGPRPPPDLRERLARSLHEQGGALAVATDGRRQQSLHALVPVALAASLAAFLAEGERKVALWQARHRIALADFSDCPDGFVNINSSDEARAIEQRLQGRLPP